MNRRFVSSILIRVANLEICRAFYRDILELGAPVVDSNFRVEFSLGNGSFLCLEKVEWGMNLPPVTERVSWIFCVDDLTAFSQKMVRHGFPEGANSSDRIGFIVKHFSDPEGNPFYVTELKARQE